MCVCVFVCRPIDVDFAYPLDSQVNNGIYSSAKPPSQLKGWMAAAGKGGGKIYSWIYYDNFHDFLMPHPMWLNLGSDIEFLARNGVKV